MQSKAEAIPLRFYAGADYGAKFDYSGELREPPETDLLDGSEAELVMLPKQPELIYQQAAKQFRSASNIHGLMNIDSYYAMSERQRAQQLLRQCQSILTTVKEQQENPVWQVDGFIKFYAERFRHIETNLSLRMPAMEEVSLEDELIEAAAIEAEQIIESGTQELSPVTSTEEWRLNEELITDDQEKLVAMREVLAHYTMQQKRRIIDEKIHYFDHPLLGLIIQMRAYDPEEAAAETTQP